jgi:hypothetical protein
MATVMPLQGTVNGYRYEFVNQDFKGTWYKLTIPDNSVYLVTCRTPQEIDLLIKDPAAFWAKYQMNYSVR